MGMTGDGSQKIRKMLLAEQRAAMDGYDFAYESVVKVLGTYAPKPVDVPLIASHRAMYREKYPALESVPEEYVGWCVQTHGRVLGSIESQKNDPQDVMAVLIDMVKDYIK
jgi:hypothetical protein